MDISINICSHMYGTACCVTYRASTNIADLAALDDIVQGLHDFLARSVAIQTMDLEHIDVRAETLDACVNGIEDVLA
jgi:hypothetical protein